MSRPPPPMPPRPPGMAKAMPPLPPGMLKTAGTGAVTPSAKMPPLPPGVQRPQAAPPDVPIDHTRYPTPYSTMPPSRDDHMRDDRRYPQPPYPRPRDDEMRDDRRYPQPPYPRPHEDDQMRDDRRYPQPPYPRPRDEEMRDDRRYPQPPYPRPRDDDQMRDDRRYPQPPYPPPHAESNYAPPYPGAGREEYYGEDGHARRPEQRRRPREPERGYDAGYGEPYYGHHPPYPEEPHRYGRDSRAAYHDRGPAYGDYDPAAPPRAAPYPSRPPHHLGSAKPLREPTNTVWIGSLDPVLHSDAILQREMGRYGMVMRIARQQEKNYGFIHFRRVEEARNAVEGLTRSGTLGPAVFNYGKMFEYTPEEMNLPYDPNNPPPLPSSREATESGMVPPQRKLDENADNDGMQRPTRRARNEPVRMEPSNVLWLGNLPHFISDDKLREVFEVFGTIKLISRMEKGNMGFIHFDTEEHCTLALQTMRDRPIEHGIVLTLNYGHAARNQRTDGDPAAPLPLPTNEVATNVVYFGQLPSDATEAELEELFARYEGFINCKLIAQSNIAFGHYDTIEHATAARVALHNLTVKGVPIRVSYGKHNHTLTLADRRPNGGADGGLDAMTRNPNELTGATGALVAGSEGGALTLGAGPHGHLTLPAMGGADAVGRGGGDGVFDRPRLTPTLSLDVRLSTLLGTTYNECGAKDLELSSTQIQAICNMVDFCVDEATEQQLDQALQLYVPVKCVHVFNVVAKRLRDCFNSDPHKKLLVLYAVTRVLLGAVTDYIPYTSDGINAYVMVLLVTSEGQTSAGMDRLGTIIESLQYHDFIEKKAKVSADYADDFRAQLDEVLNRAKAEQDLSSLLQKRRRRDTSTL